MWQQKLIKPIFYANKRYVNDVTAQKLFVGIYTIDCVMRICCQKNTKDIPKKL